MSSSSSSSSSPTKPRHSQPLLIPPPPPTPRIQVPSTTPIWHSQNPPLLLTVRFSTSIPDLLLDIPHPSQTTVIALKHLIRTRLAEPNSQRRLRFIHGGKILPDTAVLSAVLKAPPPPPRADGSTGRTPSASASTSTSTSDAKGKGKAVAGRTNPPQRVYVNCSIGDSLTDAELADEAAAAEEPVPEQTTAAAAFSPSARSGASSPRNDRGRNNNTMGSGPRGFDRLLTTGFTTAEVNQLRLQFRSIQEQRHTVDTLPSPDAMRSMEDAWIDDNNTGPGGGGGGGGGGIGGGDLDGGVVDGGGEEFGISGVLNVMIRGMFIGFVWPLGAIGWLVRDEEKIPKRMRAFVYFGFVLSLLMGTIRAIN